MPALLITASFLLAACVQTSDRIKADELPDAAVATQLRSRTFSTTIGQGATQIDVMGEVEDDQRYRAVVNFGGEEAWEELVRDDRRFVRVLSKSMVGRWDLTTQAVERCVEASDVAPVVAEAVRRGEWIEDAAGAPPEFGQARADSAVGPDVVLQSVRFLDLLPRLLATSARVREWNPRAHDYVPVDDRFEPFEELGHRFDGLPPTYDADRVFASGIPTLDELSRYFTWIGTWVDESGLVRRVEILVDVPDLTEAVDRVRRLQAERAGLEVTDGLPSGIVLPESQHQVFEVEPADVTVLGVPREAQSVDLDCLAGLTHGAGAA